MLRGSEGHVHVHDKKIEGEGAERADVHGMWPRRFVAVLEAKQSTRGLPPRTDRKAEAQRGACYNLTAQTWSLGVQADFPQEWG